MTLKYELYVLKLMIQDKLKMLKPLFKLGIVVFIIGDVVLLLIEKLEPLYVIFWLLASFIIAILIIFFCYGDDLNTIFIRDT